MENGAIVDLGGSLLDIVWRSSGRSAYFIIAGFHVCFHRFALVQKGILPTQLTLIRAFCASALDEAFHLQHDLLRTIP
jgi:hypothetical protein